jgi:adiponectin receptor
VVKAYASAFSCYIFGFVFYISKVPERFYPGKFDFIGMSHNFWHVGVALGGFMQYLNALEYQKNQDNC